MISKLAIKLTSGTPTEGEHHKETSGFVLIATVFLITIGVSLKLL